jgi:anion-transporting  ArsA/GET3 family ATPase
LSLDVESTRGEAPSVADLLAGKRVCISVGTGGVGKTTTSAAIALGMAACGLKVVVVTIDPARRLADALGVEELGNEPRLVSPERLAGIEIKGELWATMLDPKRTFDGLIDRVAPTAERAEAIKQNGIYREVSSAVSGSQEFGAVEKLYELVEDDYDLVVLDTPPAHNAAEFLNAPGRLISFLSGGPLKAVLRPSGFGMRLLGLGFTPLLVAVRAVTGFDLISDLTAFFGLLSGMTGEFEERARRVEELLRAPDTAFLMVTSAANEPTTEAIGFSRVLRDSGMHLVGAVVNRVNRPLDGVGGADGRPWEAGLDLPAELVAKVKATVADHAVLAGRDAANLGRLRQALPGVPLLEVPELGDGVQDLAGLLQIYGHLF